ncbi:MAG: PHB depolymerase family esterase [Desulfobacteraceae bacterium]|jgi:polyhydroxybutyrate depolymerase
MRYRIITFVLLLIFGNHPFAYSESSAENNSISIQPMRKMCKFSYGERERSYFLYIPSTRSKLTSLPLLIALHGGGGSAKEWPRYTNNGFESLAEKESFILVYPEGLEGQWNDRRNFPTSYAHTNNIDDVGFLASLIDYLVNKYPIDKDRVYVTGASNGGMMAHYLAANAADRIAAIATVIAAIPKNLSGKLKPSQPVSLLMINGTEDPLVPWNGGVVKFGRQINGYVMSVDDTIKFWVEHNKCNSEPEVTNLPDLSRRDGTTVSRAVHSGGKQNTEVVLYTIFGGGHTWPARKDKRGLLKKAVLNRLVGKKSMDIDACEVIWDFFKTHYRR